MENTKHFIISVALSILLVLVGTLGYMLIEGWNALDSLFMTITTLATVGYGEVHALTTMGRIYSIILILLGVGFFLYVGGAVVQFMVEGRVRHLMGRRRLDRRLSRLKDHFIICGFGRIGKVIVEKLRREHFDLVVIEKSLEMTQALEEMKIDFIIGDAGDEAVLLKAGILRAKTLVAVLATDTDNVFLVLTARQLVPELKIIARAGNE
ncbi:MAG: potassium channel family protein, partial [Desulfatitalea sp.]|nr:potassium channel family protein [Desulfatitalea sp.]NNK01111.1 potassium channel family protein [Desulfatitalea sp.]